MARNIALALTQAVQSLIAGAPVWALEPVPYPAPVSKPDIDLDDCVLMYDRRNDLLGLFPDIEKTLCDKSPSGQCEFDDQSGDERDCCIYCGARTG